MILYTTLQKLYKLENIRVILLVKKKNDIMREANSFVGEGKNEEKKFGRSYRKRAKYNRDW